ncbi:hypothetical protein MJK70_09425 [Klebsiella pneumoniae]|nr:hypothetical protein MJK70_09425 [Klebsiella pneumoniae]
MDNLTRKLRKLERDYFEMREQAGDRQSGLVRGDAHGEGIMALSVAYTVVSWLISPLMICVPCRIRR